MLSEYILMQLADAQAGWHGQHHLMECVNACSMHPGCAGSLGTLAEHSG